MFSIVIAVLIGIFIGVTGFIYFLRLLATDSPTGFFIVLGSILLSLVFLFIIVPFLIVPAFFFSG